MKNRLFVFFLLLCTASAQDVNQDGIPVLVRPKPEVKEAPKPKPKPKPVKKPDTKVDPLAKEKERLKEWESSLAMTADSLTERLRAVAERERLLAEKERAIDTRRAALDARKTAISSREDAIESARISQLPPSASPLDAVNKSLATPSDVKVKRWTGPNAPSIVGSNAMVLDAVNGRILHNKDAGEISAAADLLQLMTALIICEAGELDKKVKILESDTQAEGTLAGLRANDSHARSELLQWLLISSGSDVATALARDNAGTVSAFVEKMNARGQRLGLKNTTFKNPSGLDSDDQVTTARDLALLAWECYHQSFIREAVKTKSFKMTIAGKTRYATNPNKLLAQMGACTGMKLGKSAQARTALITSAESQGRERIVVVLRSTDSWVFKDTKVLVEWALRSD